MPIYRQIIPFGLNLASGNLLYKQTKQKSTTARCIWPNFHSTHVNISTCIHPLDNYYSVQFSCLVMSNSLWPHEPQHSRPPCPSPTPGVHPNPCPLSRWCHPTISSSVITFSSCLESFPASGSFPVSQLFSSGG